MKTNKMSEEEKQTGRETKRKNRLNSLKNEFERGSILNFSQIFAIISETQFSEELCMSFYTFRKKTVDPRSFTIGELMQLSDLIGVDYSIIYAFVMGLIHSKS